MILTIYKRNLFPALQLLCCLFLVGVLNQASCKYSFKNVSPIPANIKTFKVATIENKAPYINAQLSPLITQGIKQKIISNTRLIQTNDDNADYQISGYVSNYSVSTVGVTQGTASKNRLNVGFHLVFVNTKDSNDSFEQDIVVNEDFDSSQTMSSIENALSTNISKKIVEEVFNKIFSRW